MEPRKLEITGQTIAPGEDALVRIPAGRLPSGELVKVNVHVYRSVVDGPVVFLLAGMHGDEICGVEIIRRMLQDGVFDALRKGTIIAMPLINVYGFLKFTRDLPDGKDINRSFPGNMSGSMASRIARILSKHILPLVDMGVDFHTGGASRYNYPQVRISRNDPSALIMAEAFQAPFIVVKPPIAKSLRRVARDMGKPVVIYEGGESGRIDGLSIHEGINGVCRMLHNMGMIDQAPKPLRDTIYFGKASWVRASVSGIFIWSQSSGARVKKGEPLGVINDPYGQKTTVVLSNTTGYIIGHNNAPVVNQGDALFHIGHASDEKW